MIAQQKLLGNQTEGKPKAMLPAKPKIQREGENDAKRQSWRPGARATSQEV